MRVGLGAGRRLAEVLTLLSNMSIFLLKRCVLSSVVLPVVQTKKRRKTSAASTSLSERRPPAETTPPPRMKALDDITRKLA